MDLDLELLRLAAVGILAGFLSGLLGIGGGLVMVPLLHYALGYPFVEATLHSLVAMAIQTPAGLVAHARKGAVDRRLGLRMAAGGALGVLAGLWLQPRLAVSGLKLLFALVLGVAAWRLAARIPGPATGPPSAAPSALAAGGLGAVAGVASKLLGIGGGLVTVPALTLAGVSVHTAVGTSLVPVFTNAALAAAVALATGLSPWVGVALGIAALATGPVGAHAAHALAAPGLRRVVAGVLAAAAVYVAVTSGA